MRVLAVLLADGSGIQTYTRFLAEELAREGHEVLVVERTGGALRNAPHGTTLVHAPPYRHHGRITRPLHPRPCRGSSTCTRAEARRLGRETRGLPTTRDRGLRCDNPRVI